MPNEQRICPHYQRCLQYSRHVSHHTYTCNDGEGYNKDGIPCTRKETVEEWHKKYRERYE